MTEKTFKPLPLGNEDFVSLRQKGKYYVDKTPYLKNVFTEPSSVLLFTRPRRFGKTLLMDMFATFLAIAEDGSDNREFKEKMQKYLLDEEMELYRVPIGTPEYEYASKLAEVYDEPKDGLEISEWSICERVYTKKDYQIHKLIFLMMN